MKYFQIRFFLLSCFRQKTSYPLSTSGSVFFPLMLEYVRKILKHQNIVHTTSAFFSFRYSQMNPHVIVVYDCGLVRSADVLR